MKQISWTCPKCMGHITVTSDGVREAHAELAELQARHSCNGGR